MISLTLWNALAQIELTGALNWPLIIGILVILVLLVLAIVIPSRKALKASKEVKAGIEDEDAKPKDKQSLAELKEAKRTTVSGDKTKDEMRDLRKERRSATQTEKAVQRLEGDSSEAHEDSGSAMLEEVITQNNADTGDVFASLFGSGSGDKVDLSFEDEIGESSAAPRTSFATLGSALIPLSDFADDGKAEEKEKGLDTLDELTQRLTAKAEKKTQH